MIAMTWSDTFLGGALMKNDTQQVQAVEMVGLRWMITVAACKIARRSADAR
jgi:hypothetical protein